MDRRTNEPIVTLNNNRCAGSGPAWGSCCCCWLMPWALGNSILDMFVNKDVVKKGREVLLRHGSIINFTEPSALRCAGSGCCLAF